MAKIGILHIGNWRIIFAKRPKHMLGPRKNCPSQGQNAVILHLSLRNLWADPRLACWRPKPNVSNLERTRLLETDSFIFIQVVIKDGAYYCYCAYVLCISRYSGFLWVVPTNTGIFLHGSKLCRETGRTYQMLLVSQKKIGGNHAINLL